MKEFIVGICLLFYPGNYLGGQYEQIRKRLERKGMVSDISSVVNDAWQNLKDELLSVPGLIYSDVFCSNPYKDVIARVRTSSDDDIGDLEKAYLIQRKRAVIKSIAALGLDSISEDNAPTIGLCFSGGGFRSMVLTLGFLQGLDDIGLLDAITYMAGVSGSTWAMAPWIASGKPLDLYCEELIDKIESGVERLKQPREILKVISLLLEKALYGQHVSAMDIYGPLLANTLLSDLGDQRFNATISATHLKVMFGGYPMPIYTAISPNKPEFAWFEVTPFEIGSKSLRMYTPTWAYGRKFKYGRSIDGAQEQTLGYFMAIFGSAFEVDLQDLIRLTGTQLLEFETPLPEVVEKALKKALHLLVYELLTDIRLFPSMLYNFAYKAHVSSWLQQERYLSLIDAGIDCNLPLPPLLRSQRSVDLIMVYDASTKVKGAPELKKAQAYAHRNGLKFPPIDYYKIEEQLVSVFKDTNDPDCPIVVYVPRIYNPEYSTSFDPDECEYCGTFNFAYGAQEIKELSGLSRFVVNQHEKLFRSLIDEIINY